MTYGIPYLGRLRALGLALISAALFALGLPLAVRAADEAVKSFDIPAGPAEKTLRTFSSQAGIAAMYPSDSVRGVNTVEVKGELTAKEALDRMLAGTPLVVVQDQATGSLTVVREASVEKAEKNVSRAIAESSVRPKSQKNKMKDGVLELETYEVTGSRIRGVLGEATAQPVFTFTRSDLDRYGVQTFDQLRRYIPQLPLQNWNATPDTALATSLSGNPNLTNIGAGLRGLGSEATLVLVNGRRINKLGQSTATASTNEGYDLGGIPMSAVDHIEVLTSGASAIYGADALAGVVNVILKKDYQGTDIILSYTNTFNSDTGDRRLQLTHGFRSGHYSLNLGVTWASTNSLAPRDRWFSASANRIPLGGSDGRPNIPGGPGTVSTVDGSILPGLTVAQAVIPVNSDGVHLKAADFANTGPVPDKFDPNQYTSYGTRSRRGLQVSTDYEFYRWLDVFVEARATDSVTTNPGIFNTISLTIPAGYTGNPFGTPIVLKRVFWELQPLTAAAFTNDEYAVSVGIKGYIGASWRHEESISRQRTDYHYGDNFFFGSFSSSAIQSAVNSPDATLHPILLNNGQQSSPNSTALLKFITQPDGLPIIEKPEIWLYSAKADGDLVALPAGEVKLAVGIEAQEEYARFESTANNAVIGSSALTTPSFSRTAVGIFGEVQIPIAAEKQRLPMLHSLIATLSARHDEYSDFGGKLMPGYSLFYHPLRFVGLRASYSKGFKVPTLQQLFRVSSSSNGIISTSANDLVLDPLRNNEIVGTPLATFRTATLVNGGNPNLHPEQSSSENVGLVLELPFLKGLSASVDYYSLKYRDRVSQPALADWFVYFPDHVIRAAPTAADQAAGLPGIVTGFINTPVNLAFQKVAGYDVEIRYNTSLGAWGDLQFAAVATKQLISEVAATPRAKLNDRSPLQPWRGVMSLFWNRGPWQAGVIDTYTSASFPFYSTTTNPGSRQPSFSEWDFQAGYEFSKDHSPDTTVWQRLLCGTKISLNLINAFNVEPQPRYSTSTGALVGFFGQIDPRGRRYEITLSKQF